jgi:hypothetical protein
MSKGLFQNRLNRRKSRGTVPLTFYKIHYKTVSYISLAMSKNLISFAELSVRGIEKIQQCTVQCTDAINFQRPSYLIGTC